mmetsp:Transcript_4012/g.9150  ORF Transcript_4012/g.9150 Transcript_4012/m.9150 type:complete len:220 (-) Transcript_4012:237-896(-)
MIFAIISSTRAFSLINSAYAAALASSCSSIWSLRICLAARFSCLLFACFSSSALMSLMRCASICRSAMAFRSFSCSLINTCSASCFRLSWFMYAARSFCSSSRNSGASFLTFSMMRSSLTLSFFLLSSSAARSSSFSASALCFCSCAACLMRASISLSCACSACCLALRLFMTLSSEVALPSRVRSDRILLSNSVRLTSSANVCAILRSYACRALPILS